MRQYAAHTEPAPKPNTPITAAQVKAKRDQFVIKDKSGKVVRRTPGLIAINAGPNRRQRRSAAVEKYREANNITILNNRGNFGRKVLQKMAYFAMSVSLRRQGYKQPVAA